jgi:hypothetical protein
MARKRIMVESYSGARGDEHPRALTIGDREYKVTRLISERLERPLEAQEEERRYRVLTESGELFDVIRDREGSWWLEE